MPSVWFLIRIFRLGLPIRLLSKVFIDFLCRNTATVGNANSYVEEILQNLRETPWILGKIEPLKIAEFEEQNFEIQSGFVTGLSSLYRYGDCTVGYEDGELLMIAEVGVTDVIIDLKYAKKVVFFWTKGHVILALDNFAVKIKISIRNGGASLSNCEVIQLGEYKLKKFTGVGVEFNWLLKIIANAVAKNSRQKIISALENFFQDIFI